MVSARLIKKCIYRVLQLLISCDANRGRRKSRLIENSRDLKIYQILVSVSAQSGDTVAKEVLVGILYSHLFGYDAREFIYKINVKTAARDPSFKSVTTQDKVERLSYYYILAACCVFISIPCCAAAASLCAQHPKRPTTAVRS
jgi:hypothetical protein